MIPDTEHEITAAEAALHLRISRERLVRLVQCGELRGRRDPDRGWLVSRQDVARYAHVRHAHAPRQP